MNYILLCPLQAGLWGRGVVPRVLTVGIHLLTTLGNSVRFSGPDIPDGTKTYGTDNSS